MNFKFAKRLNNLGTETAFAVSAEAAKHAAKGNKIYPFHLGDINIDTPKHIQQAAFEAIKSGKTRYVANAGIFELRKLLAETINKSHATSYDANCVSIQPGGKPIIGKFLMTLMEEGDEVLFPNPGYPIYESQINYFSGVPVPYTYKEVDGEFVIDIENLEKLITNKTKILIFNDVQNPTGSVCNLEQLEQIARIVRKYDLYVLSDEAYFDMRYDNVRSSLVSLPDMEQHCVILYTFSKKYAMTGWRLGAALGPEKIIDAISKLNTNAESCTTSFVQYAGLSALEQSQEPSNLIVQELYERLQILVKLLNQIQGISCAAPKGTFYLFANVTNLMRRKEFISYDDFRIKILKNTGVSFCTRQHFGSLNENETDYYIRLAYSGITISDIKEGIEKMGNYLS